MFSREFEIVRLVARHAQSLWQDFSGEQMLQAERGYGSGVADLVVLDIDRRNVDDRRARRLPPARRAGEAAVLEAVILRPGDDFDAIAARVGMTTSHTRHLLSHLAGVGLVELAAGTARPAWSGAPIALRVIAVEAKLANWREGAIQASRYLDFADEAYLAMPAAKIETLLSRPDRLKGLGVGLIAVSPGACSIVVRAPMTSPRRPAIRRWLDEAEYAELIGAARQLIQPFPARFGHPSPAELVGAS